jgi:hypothetical protein
MSPQMRGPTLEHGSRQHQQVVRDEYVLCLAEPRDTEERLGHGPVLERQGRIVSDDICKTAPELVAIDRAADDAEVDGGIQQPIGILADESIGEGGKLAARGLIETADQSEVVEADPTVAGDEEVAGVGIAVEYADHEDLMQVGIDEGLR